MNTKQFTKKYYVDRQNTNSVKWDAVKDNGCLPMWIADADFKAPEKLISALVDRIKHGAYGYSSLPADYYDELIRWNLERNGVEYKADWIRFSKGAIDGLTQVIYALTQQKDPILITTPVYHPFSSTVKGTDRTLVTSTLKFNGTDFTMDFADIEKKFNKYQVKMMILCSPHNPIGRVWTKTELSKLFALAHKYNVLIVSDEVHCELIMPGHNFYPSLSFKKYQNNIITLNAESKSFSLALFSNSHIIIPNSRLRKAFDKYQSAHHCGGPNHFNALSSYYAFKYGKEWLDGFNAVVSENYEYVKKELGNLVSFPELQGSYLMYIDFSNIIKGKKTAAEFLKQKCKIVVNAGEQFSKGYEKWARFNLATSLDNVKKAVEAIKNCK